MTGQPPMTPQAVDGFCACEHAIPVENGDGRWTCDKCRCEWKGADS
jgi:hypothetical protein